MTDRTWIGTFPDDYGKASSWTPSGVPSSGDTAIINRATVHMTKLFQPGLLLRLNAGPLATQSGELDLNDDTIPVGGQIVLTAQDYGAVTLQASGAMTNRGLILFQQSDASNGVPSGLLKVLGEYDRAGTFTNAGVIELAARNVRLDSAAGQFYNTGSIILSHPTQDPAPYALGDFETAVNGAGMIDIQAGTEADFNAPVGAGQVIAFAPGAAASPTAIVERPETFAATFSGFGAGSTILLSTPNYDATQVTSSNGVTTLAFTKAGVTVSSLRFQGDYTSDQLILSPVANGSTLETVTITADRSAGLPVFRFFDTRLGTHFFTADLNEAATVQANRSDLVSEGVGLRAVNPAANDPDASPVYRFFDSTTGTHFFTASESEKAATLASRPDLVYEPSSVFAEHSTSKAGDVAVYRFFDTIHGTHFYTADTAERANIVANRPDLVAEGIGFYAPSL